MSTKTTFKRIALVAVAALGLGVLSVAPSSAVASGTAIAVTDATVAFATGSTTRINSDSTTAATIAVTSLVSSSNDTIAVTFYEKSRPTLSASQVAYMGVLETSTAASVVSEAAVGTAVDAAERLAAAPTESVTATGTFSILAGGNSLNSGNIGAKFALFLDTNTATVAGAYVYTVAVTTYSAGGSTTLSSADVTITVTAAASAALTASAAKSFAFTKATATTLADGVVSAADAVISGVSTAGSVAGYLYVGVRNADGTKYNVAQDSITVTLTGVGNICDGGTCGKSLKVNTTGDKEFTIVGDGSAGAASIVVATTVNTYAAKTVTFNAKSPTAITTSNRYTNNLRVGTNSDAIQVTAVDGTSAWTSPVWIVASSAADALIAGSTTPVACTGWTAANGTRCSITALAPGTAKFKVIDAATVATATTSSAEFTVTVTASTAASVAIAFDKTTYQPFEKALITVTPLDAAGKAIQQTNIVGLLASGGITSNIGFSGSSDTTTATEMTTSATSSSTSNTVAGARTYVVYMPASGDVTISATGGTGLPLAGQVKLSATASVVNS
jgi:hypothetical protein